MIKIQLAMQLAAKTGLTIEQSAKYLEATLSTITETLARGENIYIRQFGTFKIVQRKQKKARNVYRGKEVIVPAHDIIKFIPSSLILKK